MFKTKNLKIKEHERKDLCVKRNDSDGTICSLGKKKIKEEKTLQIFFLKIFFMDKVMITLMDFLVGKTLCGKLFTENLEN